MRILFMGTPDFAVPSLNALLDTEHEVCGVFTQPDKPKNRGMKLQPTPVKAVALTHDIPVYQPATIKDGAAMEIIRQLDPELIVVAAYGRILPNEILEYPKYGCINVHSSLLPKFRGAAPIHWAVVSGETETGVTIMHMAQELDAGDIIDQAVTPIDPDESVETVHDRLAEMGGKLLVEVVEKLKAGTASRNPQDASEATYAPMLSRELSAIDWKQSAKAIHDKIRGLSPWPAASTDIIHGTTIKIFGSSNLGESTSADAGTIVAAGKQGIDVACGDGRLLRITQLQAPGGKRMAAADYLRGHPLTL